MSGVFIRSTSSSRPYQLYSVGAIVLATFLGSLLAGGILMAIDYSRLGKMCASRLSLALAIVAQIAFLSILPTAPFFIAQLLLMWFIADQSLGSLLRIHRTAQGEPAPLWKAAGIGLVCCILEMTLVFMVAVLPGGDR